MAAVIRIRIAFVLLAVAAVIMFLGSRWLGVYESQSGTEVVWRFTLSSVALSGLAALLVLAAAGAFATVPLVKLRLFAILPGILGVLAGILAFGIATDRVILDPTRLVLPDRGFLGRHVHLTFDELAGVMIMRSTQEIRFFRKDGSEAVIPIGNLVQAAGKQIVQALEARDVPVLED